MPPEQREAVDWLTLIRLLGWQVEVVRGESKKFEWLGTSFSLVIISCDLMTLPAEIARPSCFSASSKSPTWKAISWAKPLVIRFNWIAMRRALGGLLIPARRMTWNSKPEVRQFWGESIC